MRSPSASGRSRCTRRRCWMPSRIGVSGFLISCATCRAISPHASTRSARESSVMSLSARTAPPISGPSGASAALSRRLPSSSSARVAVAPRWARKSRTDATSAGQVSPSARGEVGAFRQRLPEELFGARIGDQHGPIRPDADHTGRHRCQHGGGPPPGFLERLLALPDVRGHPAERRDDRLEFRRRRTAQLGRRRTATDREGGPTEVGDRPRERLGGHPRRPEGGGKARAASPGGGASRCRPGSLRGPTIPRRGAPPAPPAARDRPPARRDSRSARPVPATVRPPPPPSRRRTPWTGTPRHPGTAGGWRGQRAGSRSRPPGRPRDSARARRESECPVGPAWPATEASRGAAHRRRPPRRGGPP